MSTVRVGTGREIPTKESVEYAPAVIAASRSWSACAARWASVSARRAIRS
ncbi:hypothetical protein [Planomonospora parontospora]|nr:hypothetical protein [Planomonospora parontospora]